MQDDGRILVRNTRDPLYGKTAQEIEQAFAAALAGRVVSAWVFGSFATGTMTPDSDIDLMLVVETDVPFTRRAIAFEDLCDIHPALDLLVYTPAEFARLTGEPTIGFWQDVVKTMRRVG